MVIDRGEQERDAELEQFEADANQLRRNVRTWQERWEREQAEVARLKGEWHRLSLDYLELEQKHEQAQTRVTALEEAIQKAIELKQWHPDRTVVPLLEAALAAPAREGDADADPD